MKSIALAAKSITLLAVTFGIEISFVLFNLPDPYPLQPDPMAPSFVLWLHGLGDSGPANEPIKTLFTSSVFRNTNLSFPSAPSNPVTCNYGTVMPSWFDIHEIPVTADSPKDENDLLKAVQKIHAMIDKEIAAGTSPSSVFVCGFSQGGALTLASVLLYPKTLGGGAVLSGWVPFTSSIRDRVTSDAKRPGYEAFIELKLPNYHQYETNPHIAGLEALFNYRQTIKMGGFCDRTPIMWSHGMADRTVLFEAGQAGPPFLEIAGVSCEFKAKPGLGHSISNEELRDLETWIKSRLKSLS